VLSGLGARTLEFLPPFLQDNEKKAEERRKNLEALKTIRDRVTQNPTYIIEADRLLIRPETEEREPDQYGSWAERRLIGKRARDRKAVDVYSEELSGKITKILGDSAGLSQRLDSTFPTRLVASKYGESYSGEEIRNRLQLLRQQRKRLVEVGLLEEAPEVMDIPFDNELEEYTKRVLTLYVNDVEKKLKFFDEFATKIEALMEIINSLFSYKKLSITKDRGFVVQKNSEAIPLGKLSSGEQQQLVMFYNLLFRTEPHSLIMVDEPDLSLHVACQEEFLKNLVKVVKLADIDVLIATHSPEIVYDRSDLMVELAGPSN
jgi:predicted ATP-dependent endonuclease of OLD family